MHKFSSKKLFLLFAGIMLVVVFGKFFSILYFPDSSVTLEKGDPAIEINPNTTIEQKFVSARNGLSKMEFLLRTPGPKKEEVVEVEVTDEKCQNTIKKGGLKKSFISSGNLYEFKFDPIPDSEEKTYCLKIKPEKKKFKFFTMDSNDSRLELQDIPGRSLAIRTVYKNESIGQGLSELNQRISQYKPWFLKHFYLDVIVILFLATSAAIVVILILV